MSFDALAFIAEKVSTHVAMLPTEEDMNRGYIDAPVRTTAGGTQIVRLEPPSEEAAKAAVARWVNDRNRRAIILSMLEPRFATDEFLDSIVPEDIYKLFLKATILAGGPQVRERLIAGLTPTGAHN